MPRLGACFHHEPETDWDGKSSRSSHSDANDEERGGKEKIKDALKDLFPSRKPLTRAATKLKLKKLVATLKEKEKAARGGGDRSKKQHALNDLELKILVNIYVELEATAELNHMARTSQAQLSHLTPFLLNALLYGFKSAENSSSTRSSLKSSMLQIVLPSVHTPQPPLQLNSTELLVKNQPEFQLEQWLFQEAYRSILFALQCVWYFTSSLQIGPPRCYHRTMSLLLGVQSVMSSSAPPPEILKKDLNSDVDSLRSWLAVREEKKKTFEDELNFIRCLTDISYDLFDIPAQLRRDVLRAELTKLNERIPENVFLPTVVKPHRILRVVPDEAHVFNTKERAPYLLLVEIEEFSSDEDRKTATDFHTQRSSAFSDFGAPSEPIQRGGQSDEISSAIAPSASPGGSPLMSRAPASPRDSVPPLSLQKQPPQFSDSDQASKAASAPLERKESSTLDFATENDRRPPDADLVKALGENFAMISDRLRSTSPFGSRPRWRLVSVIVKARDQLRQEMFAQRLIQEFAYIWKRAELDLWLRPYEIIATGPDSGFIETVTDSKSIDSLKKDTPGVVYLQDFFVGKFGGKGSSAYKRAVKNFVRSMAGYSVVSYLLNIKDRHNGNLLIDSEGHIIHIDFGFLLSNSPGGNIEFERAPFKLTKEMVQVMGGRKSGAWKLFRKLCIQGYVEACEHARKIMLMVDIAYPGNERMPCFLQGREFVLANLSERFGWELNRKDRAVRMARLIDQARGNLTTKLYDQFQKVSLGIAT